MHSEHVSLRCGESSTEASGLSIRRISTPGGIASEANKPLPASGLLWVRIRGGIVAIMRSWKGAFVLSLL